MQIILRDRVGYSPAGIAVDNNHKAMRNNGVRNLFVPVWGVALLAMACGSGGGEGREAQVALVSGITPVADAYVSANKPDQNTGQLSYLRIDESPVQVAHLRFEPIDQTFSRARLFLFAESGSRQSIEVYRTDGPWTENSITFENKPSTVQHLVAHTEGVSTDSWIEFDVSEMVRGASVVDFAVKTTGPTSIRIASRESDSHAPRLALEGTDDTQTSFTAIPAHSDGYVKETRPDRNYASRSYLLVDASSRKDAFLRFESPRLATAQSAYIRLTVEEDSPGPLHVHQVSGEPIDEATLTFQNAPTLIHPPAIEESALSSKTEVYIDVTLLLNGTHALELGLTTPSSSAFRFASRESGPHGPVLEITEGAPSMPPPEPSDDPVPGDNPGPGEDYQPSFPIRAAFYYPWFPELFTGLGTKYTPSLGVYDSGDPVALEAHIQAMVHGKVDAAISSWWGVKEKSEDTRLPALLDTAQRVAPQFRVSLYYEIEGTHDPDPGPDLDYILEHYAHHPSFLRVQTRPVIFVYNADDTQCEVVERWMKANASRNFYVVMKVFPGWENCETQPDGWHQYGPALAYHEHRPEDPSVTGSVNIAPGFWHQLDADEPGGDRPYLLRDLDRFKKNIRDMVVSGAEWHLITSFNEWGEGTSVESALEWSSASGHGAYIDALHQNGGETPDSPVCGNALCEPPEDCTGCATDCGSCPGACGDGLCQTDEDCATCSQDCGSCPEEPDPKSITFGAAGDFGGKDDRAGTVMTDIKNRSLHSFFLLGDVSYSEIVPEKAWCDWVHTYLAEDYPLQLIAGNHEEDSRVDGHIMAFADCMPDRLGSDLGPGGYTVNFASDLGPVTFIGTAPDLVVDGVDYKYRSGSKEQAWLISAIRSAQAEGDWVIVGMHKNCITMGNKSCEIGESFAQLLVDEHVDLVLQGHDHDYQRSHALTKVVENGVGTISDSGDDAIYRKHAGTVFVIVGTAGRSMTKCDHSDSEAGNFSHHWCGEEASDTKGYLLMHASEAELSVEFITTQGTPFTDRFVLR